jgi:hypothetical protein
MPHSPPFDDHPRLSLPGTKYAYEYWGTGCSEKCRTRDRRNLRVNSPSASCGRWRLSRESSGLWRIPLIMRPAISKYSVMNLVKGLLIDRKLVGRYSGRWLAIRSHYLNGPAFDGLVGTASGFGTSSRTSV